MSSLQLGLEAFKFWIIKYLIFEIANPSGTLSLNAQENVGFMNYVAMQMEQG